MSVRLQNILKYLLFIGIGGVLFYLAFKNTEVDKLVNDFKRARYEYVVLSMIMGYTAFVSRGIRWTYLLEPSGFKTNTWNSIHAVTLGYLANFLVPRAGELARCTSLNRTDKIPVNRLFGTVVVERLVDFIVLILLIFLTIILEYDKLQDFFNQAFEGSPKFTGEGLAWKLIVAALLFGIMIAAYFFREKFAHFAFYSKARNFYLGFKEGLKSFKKVEKKGMFIFHTLLIWTMYFSMSYVVVFALESTENIDPSSGLFILIVGALGIIVPSPGGIGSYHYLVMLAMGVIGIAAADALSFATLAHTAQAIMTVATGLISLYALDLKSRKARKRSELSSNGEN